MFTVLLETPKNFAKAEGPPKLAMMSETVRMGLYSFQIEYRSSPFNLRSSKIALRCDHGSMTERASPPRKLQQVDREAFQARIIYIREKSGLSKKDFAESIGVSKSNYSQVESGNRMLTVDQLYNVFVIYGVPMEYLLAGQESNLPDKFRH
ncbi:helix-turn-helix transcriptional regulator [Phaeobacter gallaeciensis]|uniref:helix-turn-helix domain-containing protein n=2 Tax=Phaeobacter gallaeciensis TaxID=60890 RepID=UPI00237F071F|nr:helix-turn-helix transcriptional regulator [Phaeobacter gallaeciensis]MDE4303590.1 helix-turn-helix transcriptional regulator [Phaeobacter gallaeciensis]MDE4307928.1 helix-turn-helix transcriptional regulator [Phaeobacter gallaeciensis]MDE4312386.1 helix-turn-helix transcriptional regulator [Phaeobacter gallaeciensis]MDE4316857.1 helix-turn-helix transcriptional regulator [Phaeobacter gallaeciensis]MDE4321320.1 helix-turn-helix transcriptional regulator [Phaeobacter gallaeciensis]